MQLAATSPSGRRRPRLKKSDGGPTGDGHDVLVGRRRLVRRQRVIPSGSATYQKGDTFTSPDGCNTCSCTDQGIACTLMACAPGGNVCIYGGMATRPAPASRLPTGCNSCTCTADGNVACTERACAAVCPTVAPTVGSACFGTANDFCNYPGTGTSQRVCYCENLKFNCFDKPGGEPPAP